MLVSANLAMAGYSVDKAPRNAEADAWCDWDDSRG